MGSIATWIVSLLFHTMLPSVASTSLFLVRDKNLHFVEIYSQRYLFTVMGPLMQWVNWLLWHYLGRKMPVRESWQQRCGMQTILGKEHWPPTTWLLVSSSGWMPLVRVAPTGWLGWIFLRTWNAQHKHGSMDDKVAAIISLHLRQPVMKHSPTSDYRKVQRYDVWSCLFYTLIIPSRLMTLRLTGTFVLNFFSWLFLTSSLICTSLSWTDEIEMTPLLNETITLPHPLLTYLHAKC